MSTNKEAPTLVGASPVLSAYFTICRYERYLFGHPSRKLNEPLERCLPMFILEKTFKDYLECPVQLDVLGIKLMLTDDVLEDGADQKTSKG
jgi:hypothetical protein